MVTKSRTCAVGLLMLINCASACAQQTDQLPNLGSTIRVSVDRINVGVTVTDSHGRSVPGLRREDFRIFDNGVEQPISGFVPSEEPARLVFLVESSTADYLLVKLGKSPFLGADNLLNNISAIDRVAIVTFSKGPQLVLDFTPDKLQARRVLQEINSQFLNLQANAASGWLNLSSSVAATVDWLASFPGSKIIVVLSTGTDTSPPESLQAVQEKLRTSDVRILALSMFGDFRKSVKHKKLSADDRADQTFVKEGITQSDELLRQLSVASGGRAYFPKDAKDFSRAYGEIAQLVRSEYTLEFVPPAYDSQVHAIKVKLRHSYRADYRPAYLAPSPSAH
ncbi:MAG: VWA domain-containing protein [Candidatus Acidiferrum sp.]